MPATPRHVLALALGLVACDRLEAVVGAPATPTTTPASAPSTPSEPAVAAASTAPTAAPTPSADTPAAAPAAAATMQDVAIFVLRDKGAVLLADGAFTPIEGTASKWFQELARDHEGRIFALGSGEIVAIEGAAIRTVVTTEFGTVGSVQEFAPDRKNGFWTAGSKGVSHFADGSWTTEDATTFAKGTPLFAGIGVDAEDHPWVATSDGVFRRGDDGWTPVALPKGRGPRYLQSMVSGPDGALFLAGMDTLYRIAAPTAITVQKFPRAPYGMLGDLAFSEAGIGAIETSTENVARFLPADRAKSYRSPKDYKVGSVTALAVDDRGRLWLGGEAGIAILGPDAERVQWRSGSIEAIAGSVNHIVVTGLGPELPQAGDVKKGTVTGRIVRGEADEGLAAIDVELCESPSMIYRRTPCTGAPTHLRGRTDAEGRFTFANVPLGAYGVAVKIGKKWQITMGAGYGSTMKAGDTVDVGSIEIETKT